MEIAIVLGLVLLNGLFAMSEIALMTSRKARLQKLAESGDHGARAAMLLGDDPNKFLSTIQIGITSISILNGIVGEATLAGPVRMWLQAQGMEMPYAGYLATGLVVIVITYFPIARRVSRPMTWLAMIAKPFVRLLSLSTEGTLKLIGVRDRGRQQLTEEELHMVLDESTQSGIIEQQEHQMVRNIFRLDDRQVASFMVPRSEVEYFDINRSLEENLQRFEHSEHSRFPVLRGGWNDIVGVASAREMLAQMLRGKQPSVLDSLQAPIYVPEILTGLDLLEHFRNASVQFAFVVDEYGEVQGVVTPQDIMEVIAGEFKTQNAEDAWAVQRDDGSWLLDGLIPIPELKDLLALSTVPEEGRSHYHTLSGMVMQLLGKLPQTGDHCTWEEWKFEIVDLDGMRIDKVLVTRLLQQAMPQS
jgi:putative hemolysin